MRKNRIILILCLTMGLFFSACGSNSTNDKTKDQEDKITDLRNLLDEIQAKNDQAENKEPENKETENKKAEDKEAENKEAEDKEAGNKEVEYPSAAAEEVINEDETPNFDEEIFMQFVNGEISAKVEEDFESDLSYAGVIYDYSSSSKTYTFNTTGMTSLEQLISSVIDDIAFSTPDNEVKTYYAITNTLSGKPILAVKLENLGIYALDDDSYALFFFVVNDGQLYMTYAYDSWARSWVGIYDNMIFSGYGSGGAGDDFDWAFYIEESGHYKSLYDMEMLMGDWVAMHGYYDLHMDSSGSWSEGCEVYLLTTPNGSYYAYETDETVDKEQLDIFTGLLEAQGMTKVDDVGEVISAMYKANGIPDNLSYFEGWIQYN